MRRRKWSALLFWLSLPMSQALTAAPLDLDEAVAQALQANPALHRQQALAEAAQAAVAPAGALPDPTLRLGAANLPIDALDLTRTPMTQLQVGISQRFPFPGKRALRAAAAEQEARAVRHDLERLRLDLRAQVVDVWWRVFAADRALEAVSRSERLVQRLIDVARTRYQVGQGTQGDVLLAQLEKDRLADRRLALQAGRDRAAAELLRLLAREAPVQTVVLPATVPPLVAPGRLDQAALLQTAWAHNPALKAAESQVRAADEAVRLAQRDFYPDLTAAASYGWRDDRSDLYSLSLGIQLPIYTRAKETPRLAQARARLQAAKARRDALRDAIRGRLQALLADYRSAHGQVVLYRDRILPQAQQTVESTLSSYQVGRTGFTHVIRAEVTLDEYDSRRWQAYADAWKSLAAIEAQIGKELDDERP